MKSKKTIVPYEPGLEWLDDIRDQERVQKEIILKRFERQLYENNVTDFNKRR